MTERSEAYPLSDDPLWFKDVVFYEVHVRTFLDSNEDGIGDFNGSTEKLDYLQDLGKTAIWVLPFYPSPLRDDGYDITDYRTINPAYGTMADFRRFLRQAHLRGIRVVTELVINHTSDQHRGSSEPERPRPEATIATTTCGATIRPSTAKPGSSWRILSRRIGLSTP